MVVSMIKLLFKDEGDVMFIFIKRNLLVKIRSMYMLFVMETSLFLLVSM